MNEELEVYSDTNKLKKSLDDKRELLLTEKEKILGTRDTSKANLEKLQSEVGLKNKPFIFVWDLSVCLVYCQSSKSRVIVFNARF